MKKLVAFSLLAVASAAVAAPSATPSPDAWVGARPAVKVSVASAGAGKFRVNATVRDLRNGNVLSEPVLVATAGAPARVEIGATGTPGSTVVDGKRVRATSPICQGLRTRRAGPRPE